MKRILSLAICIIFLLGTIPAVAEENGAPQQEPEPVAEEQIELTVATMNTSSVTLQWNAVSGSEYAVYRNGKQLGSISAEADGMLKYQAEGLSSATVYSFKVVSSLTGAAAEAKAVTRPLKVKNVKLKRIKGKKDQISYSAVSGAAGYDVRYSLTSSFSTYADVYASGTVRNIAKLKRGKKYWYKVRAYVTLDGARYYGAWSNAKSFVHHDKEVKKGVTYLDGILIVNKTYKLPKSYGKGMKKDARKAFNQMKKAARKKGISLWIASGYRSYGTQKSLYNRYKRISGSYADTYSARPGHSEHQSGYCMDVNLVKDRFAKTKEGRWLAKNCYKYGFIIRYPKGKTAKTGYKYEPWHIRYVGKPLAKKLYNGGKWITMEEYFGISSKY